MAPAPGGPIQPSAAAQAVKVNTGATKAAKNTTQNSLQIAEIRDGIIIMKDTSLRSVIICHSINFDLMSPDERDAVEFSYQGFLNYLQFPVQVMIRSLRVDLDNYMNKLRSVRGQQTNDLIGYLMEDYIAYIEYLLETVNIMEKQFYIIVPYYPGEEAAGINAVAASAKKARGAMKGKTSVRINEAEFNKYKSELAQRTQIVLNGLHQMGVQGAPLNTQELIELFYSFYNEPTAGQQRLISVHDLETPIIQKGDGPAPERIDPWSSR